MFGLGLLLSMLHLATTELVQANICTPAATPIITAPITGVSTSTQMIQVDGNAESNVFVNILDNGQLAASVTSDGSGNFGVGVSLVSGSNSLVAELTDGCGQTSSSAAVLATYTPPSPPPPPPKPTPTPPPQVVSIVNNTNPTIVLPAIAAPTITDSGKGLKLNLTNYPTTAATQPGTVTKTTLLDSVFVTGSTGVAANVAIVVNGKVVADVVSDANGNFGIRVPLEIGTNKVQFIATLGNKTVTRNLTYKRTALVAPLGTTSIITYIVSGGIVIALFGYILFVLARRRKKRESAKRGLSNAPARV
jgi:uncharacterized membrane protein YdcZ (DUF606 family)